MATKRGETRVPIADIDKEVRSRVESADPIRAAALDGLRRVREVKAVGLERERTRLAAKYGDQHPRVKEFSERIEANKALVQGLAVEAARAAMVLPKPDPNAWILHGHVFDKELNPVPELTIALFSRKGDWVQAPGYALTDSAGHFEIEVTRDEEGRWESASGKVFVRVLDRKGEDLHIDKRGLTPESGKADYLEIVLSDGPLVGRGPKGTRRPKPTRSKTERSAKS